MATILVGASANGALNMSPSGADGVANLFDFNLTIADSAELYDLVQANLLGGLDATTIEAQYAGRLFDFYTLGGASWIDGLTIFATGVVSEREITTIRYSLDVQTAAFFALTITDPGLDPINSFFENTRDLIGKVQTNGDDFIYGGRELADRIYSGDGDDTVFGYGGNESATGWTRCGEVQRIAACLPWDSRLGGKYTGRTWWADHSRDDARRQRARIVPGGGHGQRPADGCV